ncbi:hypothetical protein [Caballeronia sordidicola]|uniref:hypothetical protein n=1 Tax=Caballeronia sordidicola TaxID=196367 RepID=UPI001180D2C1|nr:hypothetical protein [Caballeronia sordidicola]
MLGDSVIVPQEDGRHWLLSPPRRLRTLLKMGKRALNTLDEVAREVTDPLGRAMSALIREEAAPASTMSIEDLRSFSAAGEWLRDWSALARDRLDQWRGELQRRELLEPLRSIAEDFVGREKDVTKLRSFVGIAPPETRFEGWSRWARGLLESRKPPLMIHGIGGIGKSTLMAQFILTHAAVASERGFPFAYLDFDRAALDPSNPASLLSEVLEQVSSQFPPMAAGRRAWTRQLQSERRRNRVEQLSRSSASSMVDYATDSAGSESVARLFASWMHDAGLSDRPFLLVLDTFEEVQIRGAAAVDSVFDWIEAMSVLPQLRVVIAGRAPVEGHAITDHPLGNFDRPAALAFLRSAGVEADLRKTIFDIVGGNPLSLRLSVQLVRQNAFETVRAEDLKSWFGRKDGTYIQGYLYTRLLHHINDSRIEKLAHPGLVLRRITPEIIGQVLLPMLVQAGVEELRGQAPDDLYRALKAEVSLVAEEDGALVHRKDVRVVMLQLQRQDDPNMFEALNRVAADYYGSHDPASRVSRRERAYHLLMLDEFPPAQVLSRLDHGDLLSLASALDELPEQPRNIVRAALGQSLTSGQQALLPDSIWQTYAYRRGLALLAAGSPYTAMELFQKRLGLVMDGPARFPLALALFNLLDWRESEEMLTEHSQPVRWRAIPELDQHELDELNIRPFIEAGFLAWYRDDLQRAAAYFGQARARADRPDALFFRVEAMLGLAIVEPKAGHLSQLHETLSQIHPAEWRRNLLTLRRVIFLGAAPRSLIRTAVSLLGVQLRSTRNLSRLIHTDGSRLTPATRQAAKAALAGERSDEVFTTLERSAGTELAKLIATDLELDVTPYLRGRFAPWKIPLRVALLAMYPNVDDLRSECLRRSFLPEEFLSLKARSARSLADAIVDRADQHGDLMRMAEQLLLPEDKRSPDGVDALFRAMQRYAAQLPDPIAGRYA